MSSKGGSSSQTQTSTVTLPDWINTAAQSELSNAQTLAQTPYQADPYATVAPMTSDQTSAYNTIRNMQGAANPAYSAAETAAGGLLGQAAPITTAQVGAGATSLMNPYTAAVVAPSVALMGQQLQKNLGTIDSNAANVGAFGGSRQGVEEGTAISQEGLQAGQLAGGLLQQGYGQALSTSEQIAQQNQAAGEWATSELPQLATAQQAQTAKEAALQEGAGRAEQGQAQAVLDAASQNFQSQIEWPYEQQQVLEQALQSTPYGTTTTTTGPAATKNSTASALGGAASGASIGSMFGPIGTGVGALAGGLLGAFN